MFINTMNLTQDGMRIDVIRYRATYLKFEAFQFFFQPASLLFTVEKLFEKERSTD